MSKPTDQRQGHHARADGGPASLLPALALLVVSAVAIASASLVPGPTARQVAVLFNPLASQAAVVAALAETDVRMVRNGATDSIVVVELGRTARPADLYKAGAWLVLDAVAAGGCTLLGSRQQTRS
jgi:hypothetical protein